MPSPPLLGPLRLSALWRRPLKFNSTTNAPEAVLAMVSRVVRLLDSNASACRRSPRDANACPTLKSVKGPRVRRQTPPAHRIPFARPVTAGSLTALPSANGAPVEGYLPRREAVVELATISSSTSIPRSWPAPVLRWMDKKDWRTVLFTTMSTSSAGASVTRWPAVVRSRPDRGPISRSSRGHLASVVGEKICVVIDWAEDWSIFED